MDRAISEQRPRLFSEHLCGVLLEAIQSTLISLSFLEEENEKVCINETTVLEAGCRIHRSNCSPR
jgi:hypothetical protein